MTSPEEPQRPSIEAKPTTYNDVTFRSTLEANWAATLDQFRIAWEYEPKVFTLPSGTTYIPDFRLPELGTWLEVKGPTVPRIEKAVELGQHLACKCAGDCACQWPGGELVLVGRVPEPRRMVDEPDFESMTFEMFSVRARRYRFTGYIAWTSAHGPSVWFIRDCPGCGRAGWMRGRCRACGNRCAGVQAYNSGDQSLKFASHLTVQPPDVPDEAS
jgi:hypothetical protein